MRSDEFEPSVHILIEVDLHNLEPGLFNRAVPEHLVFEHLEDCRALVLQIRVGVLPIDVKDDLANRVLGEAGIIEWDTFVRTALSLGEIAFGLDAHKYGCLDYLFNGV